MERFAHFPKMTHKRWMILDDKFDSFDDAWVANKNQLLSSGLKEEFVDEFISWRNSFDENKAEKILKQEQINIITKTDKAYPHLLKEIHDPPYALFVRGELQQSSRAIAIVGSRKNSQYGKYITEKITNELTKVGFVIVSGLALGIDAIAHRTSITAGGTTIAVLGGGVNRSHIEPSLHRHLSEQILEKGGSIISEYPPGTLPSRFSFPMRNRIIAGMTLGTLVTEASKKSGALITASVSMELGRDVFAIPQNINSENSSGVNELIRNGANLIVSADDILEILQMKSIPQININYEPKNNLEKIILDTITREPKHINLIIRETSLPNHQVMSTLMILELTGAVHNIGSNQYLRT